MKFWHQECCGELGQCAKLKKSNHSLGSQTSYSSDVFALVSSIYYIDVRSVSLPGCICLDITSGIIPDNFSSCQTDICSDFTVFLSCQVQEPAEIAVIFASWHENSRFFYVLSWTRPPQVFKVNF